LISTQVARRLNRTYRAARVDARGDRIQNSFGALASFFAIVPTIDWVKLLTLEMAFFFEILKIFIQFFSS